jgi:hypothetical protein
MKRFIPAVSAIGLGLLAPSAQADLFSPDTATASSQWSGTYDIGNTIDGSGLPTDFGPDDAHANYAGHNHWTTSSGRTVGEFADFGFNAPTTVGTFHVWNHRSNNIASNDDYAVARFDLELFDADDNLLFELLDQSIAPAVAIAQSYTFAPVDDVSRVRFTVVQSQQELQAPPNSTRITGLAEVAFEAVPEPSSLALLAAGSALLACRRRA